MDTTSDSMICSNYRTGSTRASPPITNKNLDSESKRRNTAVQHTKYCSSKGKVSRYLFVGTTEVDYGTDWSRLLLQEM